MQEQIQPTQGQGTQQTGGQFAAEGRSSGQPQQQGPQLTEPGSQGMGQQGAQPAGQQGPVGQAGQQSQPGQTGQVGQMGHTGQSGQPGGAGHIGQQAGQTGQAGQGAQGMGYALQDVETPEQYAAVENVSRAIQVCGWCADQCIQAADPSMIECIRLCEDVTEIGEAALALIPRNSRFVQPVLRAFEQAAQACAQECGQHGHAHCQECAQVLPQAVQSIQQFQATEGQQGTTGF